MCHSAVASVRAASGSSAPIVLDIPVFSGGYGTAFYEETARLFEAERPDVRINLYGDPRIQDKIRVRVIDGDLPDATFTPRLLWPALIEAGMVRELTPFLDGPNWEGDTAWRETFLPGALESWRVGDGIYGVPFGYACWTLFYNRALFREHGWAEPRTWDEFFALCEAIQATGTAPVALTGIYGNYPDAFIRAAYYSLAGPEGWAALNNLAPGARTDPRYVRAADILQRITQNHTIRGWEGMTHTAAQLAFLDGRAAMTVSGSWMINEMAGKIPDDFEIGVMNFPVFPEGVADPTTIQTGADCFFVFATGRPEHESATIDFLRFLTSQSRAAAFVRQHDAPVAVRGVPENAYSPMMRPTAALIAQARDAFNMPQLMLQPPAIRQVLVDARLDLVNGHITPEVFGARVEAAAALDRERVANPNHIEVRHAVAGSVLLAVLAGAGIWAGRQVFRQLSGRRRQGRGLMPGLPERRSESGRKAPPTSESTRTDADVPAETHAGYFGPLRAPMAWGFVGPALLLYAAFVLLPGGAAFAGALLRWDGLSAPSWAGLFNFKWLLFESDGFWLALGNNLFLMLVPTLVVVPLALLFATLFHRGVWGAGVFRVVFLFPNLLGGIAATLLWLNAYEPAGGLVNAALSGLGKLVGSEWLLAFAGSLWLAPDYLYTALFVSSEWLMSFDGFPWLAPAHLYPALIPIYIWMACGFNLILYLAAMESIDAQLYEAAEIDGASQPRQFFTITLPLIREVLVISAVFIVISGLNAFEMIWLLTSQDPDSATHTLGTLMVSSMFKDFDIGRATAIAVVLFVLVFAASAVVMRGLRRDVVEM